MSAIYLTELSHEDLLLYVGEQDRALEERKDWKEKWAKDTAGLIRTWEVDKKEAVKDAWLRGCRMGEADALAEAEREANQLRDTIRGVVGGNGSGGSAVFPDEARDHFSVDNDEELVEVVEDLVARIDVLEELLEDTGAVFEEDEDGDVVVVSPVEASFVVASAEIIVEAELLEG